MNYFIPLHWESFDKNNLEYGEYYIGIKRIISDVLIAYEVLPETYEWNPVTKDWMLNDTVYNLHSVICIAKKYPITFPKEFRA